MKSGFTLIELIIVILLFSVIVAFVSWGFVTGLKVWNFGKDRADMIQNGNLTLEKMMRELSQASSITDADDNTITFLADIDDDGADEAITYSVSSNNINRTEDGTSTILASDVQTFQLSYRDLNDNAMSIPSDVASQQKRDDIRIITIALTFNKADETINLSSSVYARNQ